MFLRIALEVLEESVGVLAHPVTQQKELLRLCGKRGLASWLEAFDWHPRPGTKVQRQILCCLVMFFMNKKAPFPSHTPGHVYSNMEIARYNVLAV